MMALNRLLFCCLLFMSCGAHTHTTMSIKQETEKYVIDIQYPQKFSARLINLQIKQFIKQTQSSFLKELVGEEQSDFDDHSKSGLYIRYSVPYEKQKVLSVRFDVSIYHRGAAHPMNTVSTINFINKKRVALRDLFLPQKSYLQILANWCQKQLLAKNISPERWIREGTKPVEENYNAWFFTPKELVIVFNTYQVAAYVYGPQKIAIPLSAISTSLKPGIVQTVWKKINE